jgi:hypothetical protein
MYPNGVAAPQFLIHWHRSSAQLDLFSRLKPSDRPRRRRPRGRCTRRGRARRHRRNASTRPLSNMADPAGGWTRCPRWTRARLLGIALHTKRRVANIRKFSRTVFALKAGFAISTPDQVRNLSLRPVRRGDRRASLWLEALAGLPALQSFAKIWQTSLGPARNAM